LFLYCRADSANSAPSPLVDRYQASSPYNEPTSSSEHKKSSWFSKAFKSDKKNGGSSSSGSSSRKGKGTHHVEPKGVLSVDWDTIEMIPKALDDRNNYQQFKVSVEKANIQNVLTLKLQQASITRKYIEQHGGSSHGLKNDPMYQDVTAQLSQLHSAMQVYDDRLNNSQRLNSQLSTLTQPKSAPHLQSANQRMKVAVEAANSVFQQAHAHGYNPTVKLNDDYGPTSFSSDSRAANTEKTLKPAESRRLRAVDMDRIVFALAPGQSNLSETFFNPKLLQQLFQAKARQLAIANEYYTRIPMGETLELNQEYNIITSNLAMTQLPYLAIDQTYGTNINGLVDSDKAPHQRSPELEKLEKCDKDAVKLVKQASELGFQIKMKPANGQ
jgi:hypothetical protein